jgi:hypothetical protein
MGRTFGDAGFRFKCQLLNVRRTIPYLDVGPVIEFYAEHGVPICFDDQILSPPRTHPETFALPFEPPGADEVTRIVFHAVTMFEHVAISLGVPSLSSSAFASAEPSYLDQLQMAGERAMEAQAIRNASGVAQ